MASLVDNMADEWVASTSYSVGNCVMHNNKLYECIQDTSSATFDDTNDWKLAYLVDFMTGKGNSDSGGKLLWTNSNPNIYFSPQTISLDLSKYDGIIIEIANTINDSTLITRGYIKKGETLGVGSVINNTTVRGRSVTVTNSSVYISDQLNATTSTVASTSGNGGCIPTKIYGVNLNLLN